ncbi:MAG: PAS domain S-box protein [Ignavibacteriaceae bacterium]|nr:PAS domain S-box protein [Ignavibacteriaceae bacterium]
MKPGTLITSIKKSQITLFFASLFFLVVFFFYFLNSQRSELMHQIQNDLRTVAKLKSDVLDHWVETHISEARDLYENPNFQRDLSAYFLNPSQAAEEKLKIWLNKYVVSKEYTDIILADKYSKPILALAGECQTIDTNELKEVLQIKDKYLTNFFTHKINGEKHIHLSLVVRAYINNNLLGVLLLRINPEVKLYPLIQEWPAESMTAENLLVRRLNKDSLIFLNELRHLKNTALTLTQPLTSKTPAAQGVLGYRGFYESLDYRENEKVLSYISTVQGTDWVLVTKVDYAEVIKPLHNATFQIIIAFLVVFLSILLTFYFIIRGNRVEYFKQLYERQIELNKLQSQVEMYSRFSNEILMLLDLDGNILETSNLASKVYGYDSGEFAKLNIFNLTSRKYQIRDLFVNIIPDEGLIFESEHIKKDGSNFFVEISLSPVLIDGKKMIQALVRDISLRKKSENDLFESKRQLSTLINNLPGTAFRCQINQNWTIVYMSDGCYDIFGYSSEDLVNNKVIPYIELIYPEDRKHVNESITEALRNSLSYDIDYRIINYSGEIKWVREHGQGVTDLNGFVNFIEGFIHDITMQKLNTLKLTETTEYLDNLITYANAPIIVWDSNRKITRFNNAFSHLTGYSEQEVLNQNLDILFPPESLVEIMVKIAQTTSGKFWDSVEIPILTKSGEVKIALWNSANIYYKSTNLLEATIAQGQDITDRKVQEIKMNQLIAKLEISNKELEQFAYVASHDLQEPLRMVSSFTQLLAKRYKDKLDSDALEFIQFAVDGAGRMQALINDLLDFSRVTTKGKEFAEVDMNSVISTVLLNLKLLTNDTNALVHVDKLPVIFGDQAQLLRLCQNLIVNSIKYRKENEKPVINISFTEEPDYLMFAFKDNGIGIDNKFFDKIFQIFQRLHSRKDYEGTGIGLAICKKIVERHGGKIWVESSPGEGSCFYFSIPKIIYGA